MQFKHGAKIYSVDEHGIGSLDSLVMDPRTKEVTHLVVHQGLLSGAGKVAPVEMVQTADEDRIILREGRDILQSLPDFEEEQYIHPSEGEFPQNHTWGHNAPPLYWYPAVGHASFGYPGYPGFPLTLEVKRNIPEHTIAVQEGARVIDKEGQKVGNVARIFVDSESQEATHILISKGLLQKERRLIPMHWVDVLREDKVRLVVTTGMFEELPEFKG